MTSEVKTYSAADLAKVQRLHKLWACDQEGGQRADLHGADLHGADLQGADLRGADLRGADLRGAYLQGADLRGAYLQGADLRGADLRGADLQGANLQWIHVAWNSHDLLSEILRRGAGNDLEKRMIAGLILASPDWCWRDFLRLEHSGKAWALDELRKWLLPDETHPYLRPTLEVKAEP